MAPEPRVSGVRVAEGDLILEGRLREIVERFEFFGCHHCFYFWVLVYTLYFFMPLLLPPTYSSMGVCRRTQTARLKFHPGSASELVQPVLAPLEQLEQIR